MGKESYKVQRFMQGSYSVLSKEDMEGLGEASVYSQNIEAISERGVLKGVDGDKTYSLSAPASAFLMDTLDTDTQINANADTRDLVFYDKNDGWMKVITDFYKIGTNVVESIGKLATAGHKTICFEKKANSLYIGIGPENPSYFLKYFNTTQFGQKIQGYKLCLGELSASSFLSDIDKVINPGDAWGLTENWNIGYSATLPDRVFAWKQSSDDVEGFFSPSLGAKIVSITESLVEPNVVWVLKDVDNRNVLSKVLLDTNNFSDTSEVFQRECILGFTCADGTPDERTEVNMDFYNNGTVSDYNSSIGGMYANYIMNGGRDILTTMRPDDSDETVWVCTINTQISSGDHVPVAVDMIDWLTEDQSRLLDHNETINHFCEISNATIHPCFNHH